MIVKMSDTKNKGSSVQREMPVDSMDNQGVQGCGLNLKRKKEQRGKLWQREKAGNMRVNGEQYQGFKVRTRV